MAEIRVNVTASKSQRVNVFSSNIATEITATPDTSQYYSNLAKNWAISENIVNSEDYSSKHYAKEAQQASALANTYKEATEQAYISFSEQYANAETELTSIKDASVQEINTAVTDGKTEITTTKDLAIDAVNNTKTTILQDIEFVADGEKQEIEDLIDNGKEELKESIGDVKVLTTLEIGDIGFTQMAIDESKGKRRILNGQLIIQEQYVQFTNIIKNSVALNPDLACTEAEWQTTVTMSANGVCYKYVIDDEAGTIRLPKYPSYFDLSINGAKQVSVYGNGLSLGVTTGSQKGGLIGTYPSGGHTISASINAYGQNYGSSGYSNNFAANQTAVGVTTDPTKSGLVGSVNVESEQIKGTYFIQVATGSETEDNIVNTLELNNPYTLFDSKYVEAPLYNVSWLLANGTYNGSNAVHPSAYQALVVENNTEVAIGSTVTLPIGTEYTKRGLSVKLSTDSDITDYDFRINIAEETFMLPTKVKLASGKAVVGNGMTIGLTDGTSNGAIAEYSNDIVARGGYGQDVGTVNASKEIFVNDALLGVTTDPTKSGIETSDSDLYLYFYVGETVQNANLINAGRIEEKLTNFLSKDNKEEIVSWGMPDYTAGVSFASGQSFAQNGWLFINANRVVSGTSAVQLNGILVYQKVDTDHQNGYHTVSDTSWIPYSKNSVITSSGNFISLIFYPAKGAN